ncbi:MAG: dihydrofolate reductase family protein [Planctomycetales bacterium]|nr:dihydrofolate reductase family protein [Planctomycetales bacterium]
MTLKDELLTAEIDVCERLRVRLGELGNQLGGRTNPIVTVTYAQSIDGCIAPLGGGTLQLSNAATQRMTHQIRGFHDAILVGINTVLSDDPQLTVRLANGNDPQPIVLDTHLRFPLEAKLLCHPCLNPIIVAGPEACEQKERWLTQSGAQILRVPVCEKGLIDLNQLLPLLKTMGLQTLMVEGGSEVITNMLAQQVVDQLLVAISPQLIGGLHAVNPRLARQPMPQLHNVQFQLIDNDLVVWGQFESGNQRANKTTD